MGKWSGKICRLTSMLSLTFSFFIVELVVGYATGSLALVADSFHMLSDVVALVVGMLSITYAKRGSSKYNTFGWARAEVLGAMVNAVFLVALCFTIFVEAIQRMVETEEVTDPKLLLIVGGLGLLVNLIGLALFHNQAHGHSHGGGGSHGHSHGSKKSGHPHKNGGHGHSHEGHGHSHNHETKPLKAEGDSADSDNEINVGPVTQHDGSVRTITLTKDPTQASAEQLNMKGVFLHVLGDALGSVVVMISATIYLTVPKVCTGDMIYGVLTTTASLSAAAADNITALSNTTEAEDLICSVDLMRPSWVNYVDPILSLILVAIILTTSIPLVKDSGMILMQTVPTHIVVSQMQSQLEELDGVLAVHEFHVWSLAGDKIVASLHLHLRSLDDYVRVSNEVKEYFHDEGIHSVTIQPEFLDLHVKKAGRDCVLECGPEKDCHPATCCGVKPKALSAPNCALSEQGQSVAKNMDNANSPLDTVTVIPNVAVGMSKSAPVEMAAINVSEDAPLASSTSRVADA